MPYILYALGVISAAIAQTYDIYPRLPLICGSEFICNNKQWLTKAYSHFKGRNAVVMDVKMIMQNSDISISTYTYQFGTNIFAIGIILLVI